jgi:broad specificity phosphatase PhoE
VLTVLLTRHGHTDKSTPEQYLGVRVGASLTERGRGEAEALAKRLEGVRVDRVISSPLRRAVETARIVGRGAKVETDDRLIELDYGVWEGLTIEEIERRFPGEYEVYDANPALHHVGGGENGEEVAARVGPLIDDVLDWWEKSSADRTCVLVGHSSVNRVFLAVALGVPLVDYRRRFRQDWANLTILQWPSRDAGPELVLSNDVAHIRGVHGVTWD